MQYSFPGGLTRQQELSTQPVGFVLLIFATESAALIASQQHAESIPTWFSIESTEK